MSSIKTKNKGIKEFVDSSNSNPDNLPIIEETSLHHIVLRVRDWQKAIEDKFGEKAYLDFENKEVNAFKKELLKKGEIEENGIPLDEYYSRTEFEMKRFHLIRDEKLKDWLDISLFLILDYKVEGYEILEDVPYRQIRNVKPFYWKCWDFAQDIVRKNDSLYKEVVDISTYYQRRVKSYLKENEGNYGRWVNRADLDLNQALAKSKQKGNSQNSVLSIYPYTIYFSGLRIGSVKSFWTLEKINNKGTEISFIAGLILNKCFFEERAEFTNCKFTYGVNFNQCFFKGGVDFGGDFAGSEFHGKSVFNEVIFGNRCSFNKCIFYENVCLHDIVLAEESELNFIDVYFKSNVEITPIILGGVVNISNPSHNTDRIFLDNKYIPLGKAFNDGVTIKLLPQRSEKKYQNKINTHISKNAKINIAYANLNMIKGYKNQYWKYLADDLINPLTGDSVFAISWETCEPKPFRKTIQIVSKKILADFWKDLSVAFDYYLQLKYDKGVNVSVNQSEEGFNVDLEFVDEELNDEFEKYEKEFQQFLEDPISELQNFSKSDKTILVGKFASVFVSQVILLKYYLESGVIQENEARGFLEPIVKLIKAPKLLNIQINNMFYMFSNNNNSGNLSLANGLNNRSTQFQKTTKIINKITNNQHIKPTRKKLFVSLIVGISSAFGSYFINQIPSVESFGFNGFINFAIAVLCMGISYLLS